MSATDNLPVLCRTCGGPVEPREDLSLSCPYCGTDDRLPEDAFQRAMELKKRIAAAARGVAQLAGINAALAPLFEKRGTFLAVVGTGFGLALAAAVTIGLAALGGADHGAGAGERAVLLSLYLVAPIGLVLSASVALTIGRWSYRRRVRPLLLARSPRQPGQPLRCRACGGDLEARRELLIRCGYCHTYSIAAREVTERQIERVRDEEASYRRSAGAMVGDVSRIGSRMSRIMVVSLALTFLLMYGMIWIYHLISSGPD